MGRTPGRRLHTAGTSGPKKTDNPAHPRSALIRRRVRRSSSPPSIVRNYILPVCLDLARRQRSQFSGNTSVGHHRVLLQNHRLVWLVNGVVENSRFSLPTLNVLIEISNISCNYYGRRNAPFRRSYVLYRYARRFKDAYLSSRTNWLQASVGYSVYMSTFYWPDEPLAIGRSLYAFRLKSKHIWSQKISIFIHTK